MKRRLLIFVVVVLCAINAFSQLPGSGKDINFGSSPATNPSVVITNTFPQLTTNFTITAWIKTTNNTKIGQRIFQNDEKKSKGYGLSLGDPGTGRLRFYSRGTSTTTTTLLADGTTVLANNTWYHVAAVVNITAKTVSIYENGVLDVTVNDTRAGTFGTDANPADFGGEAPASGEAGNGYYVHGEEDEVIIWNSALTQAQIQAAMCSKQSASNPGILAYWNCDYATTASVPDLTSNGYNGTMSVGMVTGDIITSGAAIGDYSQYNYSPATWTGVTITLPTTTDGQIFSVSNVLPASGATAPTAVQVYQVNSVPNTTTGITGLGTNNVYFGVYVVNGTAPTYNAKIDYTAYDITTQAQVFMRQDNSITSWTAGNTNTTPPPYAITESAVTTRKEFILGSSASALPIQLTAFTAGCYNNSALLQWTTATEINNDHFTIERTKDGENYETVATVKGAGNSDQTLNYSYIDNEPLTGISYYRLSQTDFDGTTTHIKTIVFIPCQNEASVYAYANNNIINVQINSVSDNDVYNITLLDALGRVILTKTYNTVLGLNAFNIHTNLTNGGIYILRIEGTSSVYTRKIMIGTNPN